jgi:hypothetical protein
VPQHERVQRSLVEPADPVERGRSTEAEGDDDERAERDGSQRDRQEPPFPCRRLGSFSMVRRDAGGRDQPNRPRMWSSVDAFIGWVNTDSVSATSIRRPGPPALVTLKNAVWYSPEPPSPSAARFSA